MGGCTSVASTQGGLEITTSVERKLGWKRDTADARDRVLTFAAHEKQNLPKSVDLRPKEGFAIYDQGHLGSCTANSIAACFEFNQLKEGLELFTPSRLFIYYNERSMEGTTGSDSGAMIRDGIKSIKQLGVCPESMWPYDESKFTEKPSAECFTAATKNMCQEYARVDQTLEDIKACLSSGYPFAFGFAVYKSFMTKEVASTGVMEMPKMFDQQMGGHAVQACGYDDERKVVIVRNSWGQGWGDKGYFYMPYEYITNPQLCMDFWAVKSVAGKSTRSFNSTTKAELALLDRRLGWKKDTADDRDRYLVLENAKKLKLPKSVDLRPKEGFAIYDQGHLGSCTANAIAACFEFDQVKQNLNAFVPSRLFIYYNERDMEGSVGQDAGAMIRDGIKSIKAKGVCPETMWPYDESKFTEKPSADCYEAGLKNQCLEYARVEQTIDDMKACLNSGFPFVFGFAVYKSFMTQEVAKTGKMTMPSMFDQPMGGHAVQACGYDDEQEVVIVRNSWGNNWGDKGYFYMPYKYITNEQMVSDIWAVKCVDGKTSKEFKTVVKGQNKKWW